MLARRSLTLLLILVSGVLLFWRLDGALLWRDEATTANWARLMAESGSWLPYVFDEQRQQLIVQGDDGHDMSSKMLPAMQSWLQFYVSSSSFRLLGVSEFSARLPYAIFGAVALWLLYRIGLLLFGPGIRPLMLPALAVMSIHFLNAARHSRYYAIVVAAACWLLLEFCHYLRNPEVAGERSFYIRLGLGGFLLYFANYVSFAGMWAALGLFVLCERDARLLRNFLLLSGGMAVVMGLDFWLFHSEFVGQWPPPAETSNLERYRSALINRGRDFWRAAPVVFLVPAAFYLVRRHGGRLPAALTAALGLASFLVFSPVFFFSAGDTRAVSGAVFWLGAALCLCVPFSLAWCWKRFSGPGVWTRAALLGALVLVISPAIAIAAGKEQASPRHYYQTIPAAVLLTALAAAGLERTANRGAAAAFFAAALLWPALDFNQPCCDQAVERQFFRDASYNGPLVIFLRENLQPGDTVAFYRNVKGMPAFFYLPEMRWVELLNSEAPHNRQFRGKIPDDQFDDHADADWYVLWDPRGGQPRGLTEEKYEKVWEYEYEYRLGWWDRNANPSRRKYEIYRRRAPASPEVAESPAP
jgi:4-amino-4-deoxy-L-arabinose transferase-like glycosyltransferase